MCESESGSDSDAGSNPDPRFLAGFGFIFHADLKKADPDSDSRKNGWIRILIRIRIRTFACQSQLY